MEKLPVIASWSGGKDCCLACYRVLKQGCEIKGLLNLVSRESGRCCFHGIDGALLRLQAELIGLPLIQKDVAQDMRRYEEEFKAAISQFKGITGMVFGDIYLEEHKNWVDRVCRDIGITTLEPLWNEKPAKLMREFVGLGFKAVVVSCQADKFDRDFVGRCVDEEMIREFERRNICPCGENGEFHTFVVDGPIFRRRVEIVECEPVLREGFWKHWSLEVRSFK